MNTAPEQLIPENRLQIEAGEAPKRPLTGRAVTRRKLRVEETHRLDIAHLKRAGHLHASPGTAWLHTQEFPFRTSQVLYTVASNTSGPYAIVVGHEVEGTKNTGAYPVKLESTPCHFGGTRLWFRCPLVVNGGACRRRCRVVYRPAGSLFGCRECHQLTYQSRQQHRDPWYEGFGRTLALRQDEIRRPFWTLSPTEMLKRHRRYEQVTAALDRFTNCRSFA